MASGPDPIDVLLVGGGVASVRCARTLRRSGFAGSIVLVGDEPVLPYNRPPLSKELLRDDVPEELVLAEAPSWYERRSVRPRTGVAVGALDLEARIAELEDGTRLRYGRCLLATGASPRELALPGGAAPVLRTLHDARRLRAVALDGDGPLEVVGGGLIGIEVASSLAAMGRRVALNVRGANLWGGSFGTELSGWALARLSDAGVGVQLGAGPPEASQPPPVLAAIGVEPRTAVAEAAGLEVAGGIVTDDAGRTSDPTVWAAGDVARSGQRRIEHWHHARESGERAALSMLEMPLPRTRAPWIFTEVAGQSLDVVGDGLGTDWEGWVRPASVLVRARAGRVAQIAIIGGAADVAAARGLVERGASVSEAQAALAS